MEMFRNMEVVLMLCFGLIVTAALLARPGARDEPVQAQGTPTAQMPVVVITGKRLPAADKVQPPQEAG